MAITALIYALMLSSAFDMEIDWEADTIYCALVLTAYTPNQDTHAYWSDVVANEHANSGNYVTNGDLLTTATITYTGGTNLWKLDADDAQWLNSTITAYYAVVYDRTPASDATRPLISYVDFGANQTTSNGTFDITWHADGIVEITVA